MNAQFRNLCYSALVAVMYAGACLAEWPTTLFDAARNNMTNEVREMLAEGVEIDKPYGGQGHTSLARAAFWGHIDTVRILLDAGADPLVKDKYGNTPFHLAAGHGQLETAQLLLATTHESVTATNSVGISPLYQAARSGAQDTAIWLLEQGADANSVPDETAETPLQLAAGHGQAALVKALLQKEADIHVRRGEFGWTPLHRAVPTGDTNTVSLLISAGCNVNARDARGMTPLHLTVRFGVLLPEMIDVLANAGADVNAKDERGRTPLDVCEHQIDEIPRLDWIDEKARNEKVALFKQIAKRLRHHGADKRGRTTR